MSPAPQRAPQTPPIGDHPSVGPEALSVSITRPPRPVLTQLTELSLKEQVHQVRSAGLLCTEGERTDPMTGLPLRAALVNPEVHEKFNRLAPGTPLVLAAIDIDHMRLANQLGFSVQVDELKKSIKGIAAQVFGERKYHLQIDGGDEFTLILEDSPQGSAKQLLQQFLDRYEERRDQLIPRTAANLNQAERLAEYRIQLLRALKASISFDTASFNNISFEAIPNDIIDATNIRRVLGMSLSAVSLRTPIDQTPLCEAHAIADKGLSQQKLSPGSSFAIAEYTPNNPGQTFRDSDKRWFANVRKRDLQVAKVAAEVSAFEQAEDNSRNRFALQKKIQELIKLQAQDLSVPDIGSLVYRLGLIERNSCGDIFSIKNPTKINAVYFDITGFGAQNKASGQARADQDFTMLVAAISGFLGSTGTQLIRMNGGGCLVVSKLPLDSTTVASTCEHTTKTLIEGLRSLPSYRSLPARYFEVSQLIAACTPNLVPSPNPWGTVTAKATSEPVEILPSMSMKQAIELIQSKFPRDLALVGSSPKTGPQVIPAA